MNAPAKERPPHFYSDLLIAAERAAKCIGQTTALDVMARPDGTARATLRVFRPYEDKGIRLGDVEVGLFAFEGEGPRAAVAGAAVAFFVAICKVADAHAEAAAALRQTVEPFLTPENTGT